MLDVLLVRHAIAENRDPDAWPDDALRPLTDRGVERFRSAARGLRQLSPTVDAILGSPYERAWRTAELLHEEAGWPEPEQWDALAAEHESAGAVDALAERSGSVALVGHEPFLSSLASLLLTGDADRVRLVLKKGGAMLLSFERRAAPGGALLGWLLTPKVLRSLDPG